MENFNFILGVKMKMMKVKGRENCLLPFVEVGSFFIMKFCLTSLKILKIFKTFYNLNF